MVIIASGLGRGSIQYSKSLHEFYLHLCTTQGTSSLSQGSAASSMFRTKVLIHWTVLMWALTLIFSSTV